MNIKLSPEDEQFVNEKISSGVYESAEQAVHDGLRSLRYKEEFQKKIREGLDELERGEGIPGEQAMRKHQRMKENYLKRKGEAA